MSKVYSIEVEALVHQIKHMAKCDTSICNRLNSYDQVMKKYRIDPLDDVALEIYEYLIEEQTMASIPTKSRTNINPLKFSRSHIQITQQLPQSFSNYIEDPQVQNVNLFSFAKSNPKRIIRQEDLKPKQLFAHNNNQKHQSKSDNKSRSFVKKYDEEEMQQDLGLFQKQQFANQQQSRSNNNQRSVKTLSYMSRSQSQNGLFQGKNQVFNSEKTKEVQNISEPSSKQLLLDYLKSKYFEEFLDLLKLQRIQLNYLAIEKKMKYIYCMNLLKKSLRSIKTYLQIQKQNMDKAKQFSSKQDEIIVEDFFVQWRSYSRLSEQKKERLEDISNNFEKLSAFLFVNRLKEKFILDKKIQQRKLQEQKQRVRKSKRLQKILFFRQLSIKFSSILHQKQKTIQLKNSLHTQSKLSFFENLKTYFQKQKSHQKNLIQHCITQIKGSRLIQNLKNQQNFNQVYWKHKSNPKKLIFLYYLLSASKQNFQRLGYTYSWMTNFDNNIKQMDKKLSYPLSYDLKKKTFQRLVSFCNEQKDKKYKIKVMFMDRFLKHLAYQCYINCKKKAEDLKSQELINFLKVKKRQEIIDSLTKKDQRQTERKRNQVESHLFRKKSQEFFIYLQSYKNTKNHYLQLIEDFSSRKQQIFLSNVWLSFKRVLKSEIINGKLVNQYLRLKGKIITQKCFQALKQNSFDQKLLKKKEQNLMKLMKLRYFSQVNKKLVLNSKYQPKRKQRSIQQFTNQIKLRRQKQFLCFWQISKRELQLRETIGETLAANYCTHLMTKQLLIKLKMLQCDEICHTQNQVVELNLSQYQKNLLKQSQESLSRKNYFVDRKKKILECFAKCFCINLRDKQEQIFVIGIRMPKKFARVKYDRNDQYDNFFMYKLIQNTLI